MRPVENAAYLCLTVVSFPLTPAVATAQWLQPGDADRDCDIDQFDYVQVLQAGKYLTGEPATWGEGDWDGGPGGEPGNPPPGNGLFDQLDAISGIAMACVYLTGPYGGGHVGQSQTVFSEPVAPLGVVGDGQTSIVYDPGTGEVAVDVPAHEQLTSINIDSASGIFTGAQPPPLTGPVDNFAPTNLFKASFGSSFGAISFGNAARPGLSQKFVLNDLAVVGSLDGGGGLGPVDLVYMRELFPGDASRDFSFDQLDMVQVLQASKYLTARPATWGEGDWDAGPGGYPGNPPIGNGLFDQQDIVAALQTGNYLQGTYAASRPGGVRDDEQTSIIYDARTGEIAVDGPSVGACPAAVNIDSASGIFTGGPIQNTPGHTVHNIFIWRDICVGFPGRPLSFGNIAQPGLSEDFVANDLTAFVDLQPLGLPLGDVDLIYIPEPSTLILLSLGAFAVILGWRRRCGEAGVRTFGREYFGREYCGCRPSWTAPRILRACRQVVVLRTLTSFAQKWRCPTRGLGWR